MRCFRVTGFGAFLMCLALHVTPAAAASCDSLASLALPHTTITLANLVDAGSFVPFPAGRGAAPPAAPLAARGAAAPAAAGARGAGAEGARGRGARGGGAGSPFADLPAFCRVTATLMPSSDSAIKMELWMPAAGWNGKFVVPGNGGFAGAIAPAGLATALRSRLRRRDDGYRTRRGKRQLHARPSRSG